jgi:DNA polymerase-4
MLVRLIGIRFSYLVPGNYQINLFEDTEEALNLYAAMDHLRERFGDKSVLRASGMGAKTIGRMVNPFNGQPPIVLAHRKQ